MTFHARLRQLGWIAVFAICLGIFIAMSFRVHSVKTEVQLAEREIIKLKRQTQLLETEFQTRASQRQLASWNAVEFGYEAPRADQYLENERQLASLGALTGPQTPAPIRVARGDQDPGGPSIDIGQERDLIAMVSPITGKPVTLSVAAQREAEKTAISRVAETLAEMSPVRSARAAEANE
jgi:hypothetical protein